MRVRFWTHTKNNPPKQTNKNLSPSPTRPKNAYLSPGPTQQGFGVGSPLVQRPWAIRAKGIGTTGSCPSGG